MSSPVSSILRKATKKKTDKFNILTAATHEAYETNLSKTDANFYALGHDNFKGWNTKFREIPDNYILLDKSKGTKQLPKAVDFDFVLSQNKFGQFQILAPLAKQLHLPLISLEHTLPVPFWNRRVLQEASQMRGDINVFISSHSIGEWGFDNTDPSVRVIRHGINTDEFIDKKQERKNVLLSIVNDWVNRDWCCGFESWKIITEGLPVQVYGDTKGLSLPTQSIEHLIDVYNEHSVFLNTSTLSPIPTVLMEAMSCGCAIVTTGTCMIPEVVEHGYNALVSNNLDELRKYCVHLLNEPEYARELGTNARKTILEKFNVNKFVGEWNSIFEETSKVTFKR